MKKYLSLLLVALLIVSVFAGCGKAVDKNNNVVNGTFSEYLVAEKVGTLNRDNFITADGGLYYKDENGLYGVISFNGAKDTGAIFADVTPVGKYFQVRTTAIASDGDFAGLNAAYLIDGKGETVVPGTYASFYVISDRYIKVATVTERCYSKDETVVSYNSELGLTYDGNFGEKNSWYKGNWYVYDTVTDKLVPGATGTGNDMVTASGRYLTLKDAENNYYKINENGEALPEGARVFDDGSYSIEGKVGEVYDANGVLLFNYDLTGFTPAAESNGYYVANKYVDGSSKYAVMDKTGKVISTEFEDYITIYGEVVHCGEKVYNLEGKCILEGTYESVYVDKMFGQNWMLRNDDYYTVIDKDGNIFFNGGDDDDYDVHISDFLASKKTDEGNYFYSYKDRDYTIKGHSFAPWIVRTENANSMYDLVDTMTGKKLLEGYSDYESISRNALAYYVYAVYNGGADVYLVVSGAQLEGVINKKNNLFDDLAAAFKAEGINVTVNKDNGEIALDSSVLFGGDSSELTADGKAFLNKFIKAYVAVAFSEKYEGFISKTMVEGHTAPLEGSTYASGLQLSEERALNVKNYCLSAETGVDVTKISNSLENVGYSNSKPIYNADGTVNLAACRRVSFRFIVNVDF
ncbi:MAG: OmpA family protein [Clostridia bacterium]|nr:OmpA family protein [Clostridia bacterium]